VLIEHSPHRVQPRVVQDAMQGLARIHLRARLDSVALLIERDVLLLHLARQDEFHQRRGVSREQHHALLVRRGGVPEGIGPHVPEDDVGGVEGAPVHKHTHIVELPRDLFVRCVPRIRGRCILIFIAPDLEMQETCAHVTTLVRVPRAQ